MANRPSLAAQITADRDRVVIDESLADFGLLLDLLLDRRVKEHPKSSKDPIPTSARWLILPVEQPPPRDFVSAVSAGRMPVIAPGLSTRRP